MSTSRSPHGTPARLGSGRRTDTAARQETMREHNLSLVLSTIVEAHETGQPLARSAIAKQVGLTKAAVSELVDLLTSAGLVVELAPVSATGAGRPATPLAPAPRSVVGLGLSVAVGHLSATILDLTGLTMTERIVEADLRRSDPVHVLRRLSDLAATTVRDVEGQGAVVAGACVSIPGLVDREAGEVRYAPNLAWTDIKVPALLNRHPDLVNLPVSVGNDADLSARNEVRERVVRGVATSAADQSYLYVYGAIGIGSALVVDGRVFRGVHGFTGEIGHSVADPNGPLCSCGATGCLELYAGRRGLLLAAGLDEGASPEVLARRLADGDPRAQAALAAAATALGQVASTVINVVDVDDVVLGGDYRFLHEALGEGVKDQIHGRVLGGRLRPATVRRALGGAQSDARGAALTLLDSGIADPRAWVEA